MRKNNTHKYCKQDVRDNFEMIKELYESGISAEEISRKYFDARPSSIREVLVENNIQIRDRKACQPILGEYAILIEKHKDEIIEMYNNDISSCEIERRLGIGIGEGWHVIHFLKKMGIERRENFCHSQKYTYNENYFEKIDTPNKAYILGLLYSDGAIPSDKKSVRLALQERDKDILERIIIELESDIKLYYVDRKTKHKNYSNMYVLIINSPKMAEDLIKLGVFTNKSLILKFPEFLPDELMSHFLRGYFDGDGGFSKYQTSFTSTYDFCKGAMDYLQNKFPDIKQILYPNTTGNGITSRLFWSTKHASKTVMDYLYKDADMFLTRKHDKYLKYFYPELLTQE